MIYEIIAYYERTETTDDEQAKIVKKVEKTLTVPEGDLGQSLLAYFVVDDKWGNLVNLKMVRIQ